MDADDRPADTMVPCTTRGAVPWTVVDDGVCDCCDGSDEPAGFCKNRCAEELKGCVIVLPRACAVVDQLGANCRVALVPHRLLAAEQARFAVIDAGLKLAESKALSRQDRAALAEQLVDAAERRAEDADVLMEQFTRVYDAIDKGGRERTQEVP
jgi:protein kinase C substrate 80K-H